MKLPHLFKRKTKTTKGVGSWDEFAETANFEAMLAEFKKYYESKKEVEQEPLNGDGNAQFIEPMTESEYATYMHEQEHGWRRIYDRFLGRDNGEG